VPALTLIATRIDNEAKFDE